VIPGKIVRFVEQYANLAFAGTRDRNLVPQGHRVSGWRVAADARTVTALMAQGFTDGLLEALEENGQLAVTIEEFPSHETYQLKGRYLRHRAIQADDLATVARIRERFVKSLHALRPETPVSMLQAFILAPAIAVEFEVQEIYVQTPGPGAGARLVPQVEA
jgi:hypothetical protein